MAIKRNQKIRRRSRLRIKILKEKLNSVKAKKRKLIPWSKKILPKRNNLTIKKCSKSLKIVAKGNW